MEQLFEMVLLTSECQIKTTTISELYTHYVNYATMK